jgi:hypothetical protein
MKILISNIIVLFILASCNSEKGQTSDADTATAHTHAEHDAHHGGDPRITEVMAIHDSIMPAMSALMDLKQKISNALKTTDSLLAVKSSAVLQERKEKAFALHTQLDKADKEMMNWMHQYKADTLAKLDEEQAKAYIADQKLKIETVRDRMSKSISDARAFIEKK